MTGKVYRLMLEWRVARRTAENFTAENVPVRDFELRSGLKLERQEQMGVKSGRISFVAETYTISRSKYINKGNESVRFSGAPLS